MTPRNPPSFDGFADTYHAPLNPILNSIVLSALSEDSWKFTTDQVIYTPDIVITGVSMILLLASIGVSYLLITRIFDPRIGGVTALLMLLCETLWHFSQSGLPQMLMLFLFSFAVYFLYKAIENSQANKPVFLWLALTGGFMGLLALAHWMAIWPFLGLVLFAGFYFTPRGVQLLTLVGVFLLITIWWPLFHNQRFSGNPLGAGLYLFYAGNASVANEEVLMRDYEQTSGALDLNGMPSKMMANAVTQIGDLYNYLGAVVVAPLFFLALLHPFRRREIADFRWCILGMWIFAVIGMTIYGLHPFREDPTDPNNLHIIFLPVMAGYGLAFLSVLWNRLNLPLHIPVVRNGHFILAVFITALPPLLKAPTRIQQVLSKQVAHRVNYPYYIPSMLAAYGEMVKPNEAIATDIPWAVAWYAQRPAIWLPMDRKQLDTLRDTGKEHGQPVTGILFSQLILQSPPFSLVDRRSPNFDYRDYILFYPTMTLGGNSFASADEARARDDFRIRIQKMMMENMPIKYNYDRSVYLFFTELPAARDENEKNTNPGR